MVKSWVPDSGFSINTYPSLYVEVNIRAESGFKHADRFTYIHANNYVAQISIHIGKIFISNISKVRTGICSIL